MVFSCFLKCIAYSALSWSWLQCCLEEHSLLLSGSLINCKLVRRLSSVCLVHLKYAMSSLLFYLTCKIYANTWATPVTSVFSLSKSSAHLVADNLSVKQWDYLMLLARKITLGKAVKVWAKVNDWASKKRGKRVKGKKSSSPVWQACSAISSFARPDSKLLRSTWRMERCCGKKGLPQEPAYPRWQPLRMRQGRGWVATRTAFRRAADPRLYRACRIPVEAAPPAPPGSVEAEGAVYGWRWPQELVGRARCEVATFRLAFF